MATFRSNRLTCVLVWCKNRIDCTVVQAIQFSHRLVGHVAAQFVHLQDKALCVERVFCQPDPPATGSAHIKNPNFII